MTESTGALTKKVASGSPYQLDNDQVCSVLDDKKRQKNKKLRRKASKFAFKSCKLCIRDLMSQ